MPTLLSRRRVLRGVAIAVLLLVAVVAVGVLRVRHDAPTAVAIVDQDGDGEKGRAGAKLVESLRKSSEFDWQVTDPATAAHGKYLAVVSVPGELSESLATLATPNPKQATVTVSYRDDTSSGDRDTLSRLVNEASAEASARAAGTYISTVASARGKLLTTSAIAGALSSAVGSAEQQATQLLDGAGTILPSLATARAGADQLVAVSGQVAGLIDGAQGSVDALASRLSELGVTVGDVGQGSVRLRGEIDRAIALIEASGIPAADVIGELRRTQSDVQTAATQLDAVNTLLNPGGGPDTELGTALRAGFDHIRGVSGQLGDAGKQLHDGIAPIADRAPQLLADTQNQITGGLGQLKSATTSIGTQINAGVAALPAGNPKTTSAVLSAPITVVQSSTQAGPGLLSVRNAALLFGLTTILLCAALVWTLRRGRDATGV